MWQEKANLRESLEKKRPTDLTIFTGIFQTHCCLASTKHVDVRIVLFFPSNCLDTVVPVKILGLQVSFNTVATAFSTQATLADAAKRKLGVAYSGRIHTEHTGFDLLANAPDLTSVGAVHVRCETVRSSVRLLKAVLLVLKLEHAHNRSKNLVGDALHIV